jgi:hypothetical protein
MVASQSVRFSGSGSVLRILQEGGHWLLTAALEDRYLLFYPQLTNEKTEAERPSQMPPH